MKSYVEFAYYSNGFGGSAIPESDFDAAAKKASAFVRYYTDNRIEEPDDDVRDATCAVAENIYTADLLAVKKKEAAEKGIHREDNDGYSVTLLTPGELNSGIAAAEKKNSAIVRQYLAHTGLLYRGV